MKACTKCKTQKPFEAFCRSSRNKSGYASWCKSCEFDKAQARRKTPPMFRGLDTKQCPRCWVIKPFSDYYQAKRMKDGLSNYCKTCQKAANVASFETHRISRLQACKNRIAASPKLIVHYRILGLVRKSLDRRAKAIKPGSVTSAFWDAVGYTSQELARHIEAQFLEGMTWENRSLWHIDHRLPVRSFHYTSVNCPGFLACWALSNLQPLWALDNLRKGSKMPEAHQIGTA